PFFVIDDDLRRRLRDLVDPGRIHLAEAFAEAIFRRVVPGPGSAEIVADALTFAVDRQPGEIAVRVGVPSAAVVEVNVEDRPFLLSTVIEDVQAHGYTVERTLHPVIGVDRDARGR